MAWPSSVEAVAIIQPLLLILIELGLPRRMGIDLRLRHLLLLLPGELAHVRLLQSGPHLLRLLGRLPPRSHLHACLAMPIFFAKPVAIDLRCGVRVLMFCCDMVLTQSNARLW